MLSWIENAASHVPPGVIAAVLATAAVFIAVAVHSIIYALARRSWVTSYPLLHALLQRMHDPARLALVLLALNVVVTAAPLEERLSFVLGGVLQVALIGLIGWMVLATVNGATELYLRRFSLEGDDTLLARKQITQVRVLKGALDTLIVVVTVGTALMSFDAVRRFGVSLFASAGIAGIVVGLAARPVLANLLAGLQIAITQPIRIEDTVVIEGENGAIEEIGATYVVVRIWDGRRLIVPLSYFLEKPIQNWTHKSSAFLGAVMVRADYTVPVEQVRAKLTEIVQASSLWDGRVCKLQVTDADSNSVELRALVSARNSGTLFELRCEVREKLVAYLARELPGAVPHSRQEAVPPLG